MGHDDFSDSLDKSTIEGCKLSIVNAKRLAEDARWLKQNDRHQSVFSQDGRGAGGRAAIGLL